MTHIKLTKERKISEWLTVVEKKIRLPHLSEDETYYSIKVADYVAALVLTTDERVVLVKQYRPAVDQYTVELPSGLVDLNEIPRNAIVREIYEETGFSSFEEQVSLLGELVTDSGRLENRLWGFFVQPANKPINTWQKEPGVIPILVTKLEFLEMINTGVFNHALHLAIVGLALSKGYLSF